MGVSLVRTLSAIGMMLICTSGAVMAQPITPGGVLDTLKRPQEVKPAEALPPPDDAAAARSKAKPVTLAKTVTVDRFEFAGNTLFTTDELDAVVKSYTQRPITLVELYEVADQVSAFYVERGYTLASAVVPAQKVNEGTVRLEIIEGRVGEVRYEGNRRYRESTLQYFLGNPQGSVYRADDFVERMRVLDGLPGLDVRARLQPGTDYGSSDIVVEAREKAIEGSVFVDNGGTRNIGVIRSGAQLALNNPLRAADQLTLLGLVSEGELLKYGSIGYSLATGMSGARVNLSYGYAEFEVSGAFAGVGGKNRTARAELYLPLIDNLMNRLNLTAAVNDTRATSDFSGVTFNENEVTVLELGGSYTHTAANRTATQIGLILGSNFQSYDATDTASQPLKIDLDLQQLMPLPWYQLQLLTRTQFVYGLEPLPDTQKYSIGGVSTIRGYAPSEARGDWGYLAQITLRRSYLLGASVLTPRLFYDAGVVRQHRLDRFAANAQPPELALASYGLGADVGYRQFSLKLDYAVPTSDVAVSDGKEDGRFYSTFSLAF